MTGECGEPSRSLNRARFRHPGARAITLAIVALGTLAMAAGCMSGPLAVSAATVALPAYHGFLPTITGDGLQALWQADWLDDSLAYPVVSDGLVIAGWRAPAGLGHRPAPGDAVSSGNATVGAVRATTGARVWALTLPSSLPDILGLVPAGKVVVVEAGQDIGQAPGETLPVVTELLGIDQATGRQLWAVPATGDYQQPAIASAEAADGALLITGDPSGTLTARWTATGTVAWQAPAGCPLLTDDVTPPVTVAADGSLIAESVSCNPSTVIRRLDPATGKTRWTWRAPAATMAGNLMIAVGEVGRAGSAILVTGLGNPRESGTTWSAVGLPSPYPWPASLSGQQADGFTLALDAASGRPRWSQASSSHFEWYALTAGAVCGDNGGIQCRDDVTAATTMPDVAPPPPGHDESAYLADGLAVITSAPAPGGGIAVTVLAVRGGTVRTQARLGVKPYACDTGQVYAPTVVGFGALPGGGYLILLDRRDLPDAPILALRLATRPGQPRLAVTRSRQPRRR
jgi:outer membrane protein assembly factor BamB